MILESFCKEHPFEWNDINERLIDEFVLYMERYGYMKKTINKNLAVFSAMLNVAFKEGYKFKASILEHFPKLQINKEDMVVEIYLTNEELQALYDMKLEGEDDRVRDVFLVGCYTSQRFSDYSRISAKNVTFHDGVGIITLVQQKTNTEVTIPILNDNLLRIFEKYNYNLPNIQNQRLNNKIKEILETLAETMPSLKHELPTKLTLDHQKKEQQNKETYKRNSQGEALIPRYKLATTHTARRTGITLMYLEKILDTYEMMSISGHKTESVFNDYIKISGIELATNIAKKVAKARKESEVKSLLLQQFESMTAEQLTNLLELSKIVQPSKQELMKESIEDITADIEFQYGKSNTEKNIEYILSLYSDRFKDGELDDNIPVPSNEAAAKTILLILDRPELPWETICKERRVKNVMEYLFIRATGHYEEVHDFVSGLLRHYIKGITPQMVLTFMNIWKHVVYQQRPSTFTDEILYPEHSEKILDTLHFLLNGEVGRGAALVMVCARDEGLVRNIAHAKISTEFKHVSKTAYNNYLHERFTDKEKNRIISALRTRIGYTKEDDGRISF